MSITREDFNEYWREKQTRTKPPVSSVKVAEILTAAIEAVDTDPVWSVIQQEIAGWEKEAIDMAALMKARLTDGPVLSPEAYADTKCVLAFHTGAAGACKKILDLVKKH